MPTVDNWIASRNQKWGPSQGKFKAHYLEILKSIEDHHAKMLQLYPERKANLERERAQEIQYWNNLYPEFASSKGGKGKRRQTRRKASRKSKTRKH